MRLLFLGLILGLSSALLPTGQSRAETINPSTVPFESTLGRFSADKWYVSDGWRNGGHQNCTWSRRAVAFTLGRGLTLRYIPGLEAADNALCGEVQTRTWFQYGTFEARLRAEQGSGLNAAFFAYTGEVHGQPHDEIDFEILSKSPGLVWLNRFVAGNDFGGGKEVEFDPGPPGTWHELAFIWEPDRLRWFVNGTLVREVTEGIPSRAMKVYFSHWGSDSFPNWMGPFVHPDGPVRMSVNRFRYTPPGQACAFEGSITCSLP
ncbi:hypothetical protein LCGC14_0497670 [marine sediment metagenome]|uniref:GH16 domain-containing protein n=1 Tax=marine sediment metagenome TaxID=412755 RepID=A0A0F9SNA3_9ZZZZ